MINKIIPIISLIAILASCGKQERGSDEANLITGSIIVGDLDWLEVSALPSSSKIKESALAVGDIDLPARGSRCTGFLITKDIVMTNHHCVRGQADAVGVTVVFNHLLGAAFADQKKYDCSILIGNDRLLDYALLKCKGSPGEKYGIAKLAEDMPSAGDSIYVVQQNCDYYLQRDCDWTKKYSMGKIKRVESELIHNADTLGGSSGSPVFSKESNEVVGLHHAGFGNNGIGRGYENYAVPMKKVLEHILTHLPEVQLPGVTSPGPPVVRPTPPFNNSIETAATLFFDKVQKGEIERPSEADYYKFVIRKNSEKITLELKFSHSKGDLDLYILNSKGRVVAKSDSIKSIESLSKNIRKGTYFVRVKGYKNAKGKYAISLKK